MRKLAGKKIAAVLAVSILCFSFTGCSKKSDWVPLKAPKDNVESVKSVESTETNKESSKESQKSDKKVSKKTSETKKDSSMASAAKNDPSLKGHGNVGILEKTGNKNGGFALSGTPWYSKRENFIKGLMTTWPGLAKAEIVTDYNKDGSSIYHFDAAVEFKDFPRAAGISWTEEKGQVISASYIFTFPKDKKEAYRTAFLQARDMMTETFGKPDEEMAPFEDSLPGGATWKAEDGSGIGISDSSIPDKNLQFSITLSAGQAVG